MPVHHGVPDVRRAMLLEVGVELVSGVHVRAADADEETLVLSQLPIGDAVQVDCDVSEFP